MGFDRRSLQPAVLQFEIPEPLGVRHGHATKLGTPGVERGITEAMPPAQLLNRHTGLYLREKVENLFFRFWSLQRSPGQPSAASQGISSAQRQTPEPRKRIGGLG